jgi:hypothetical protein
VIGSRGLFERRGGVVRSSRLVSRPTPRQFAVCALEIDELMQGVAQRGGRGA